MSLLGIPDKIKIGGKEVHIGDFIPKLLSNDPVTYADLRTLLMRYFMSSAAPGPLAPTPVTVSLGPDPVPVAVPPTTPTTTPTVIKSISCWLENYFHSWLKDGPEDSDMSTSEEVARIVAGDRLPPGAVLWLMHDAPTTAVQWHFVFNGVEYVVRGVEDYDKGPFFRPNGWRRWEDRIFLVRITPQAEPNSFQVWVTHGTTQSPAISFNIAGKK